MLNIKERMREWLFLEYKNARHRLMGKPLKWHIGEHGGLVIDCDSYEELNILADAFNKKAILKIKKGVK